MIRTWRLKREGEYRCPRCSGISNIYLSPLIYVFALIAVFAGGALYFFHKFILNDIEPMTALEIFIPFAVFFFISLFFVYLEKPMMKKMPKSAKNRKSSGIPAQPVRKVTKRVDQPNRSFSDDEYMPRTSTQTGPIYQGSDTADFRVVDAPAQPPASAHTEAENVRTANRPYSVSQEAFNQPVSSVQPPARPVQPARAVMPVDVTSVGMGTQNNVPSHSVSSVDISGDYFSKYDDPEYIKRRMEEMQNKNDG